MSQQTSINNNFTPSPGYNGPSLKTKSQHDHTPKTATAGHKKFRFATWFVCCVKHVSAAEYVGEYHKAQACSDILKLVLTLVGVFGRLNEGAPEDGDRYEELKWAELSGRVAFGTLHVIIMAISLCCNCKASKAAASSDPSVRAAGGFKIGTILGIISSSLVVVNLFLIASVMTLLTFRLNFVLRFYHADDLSTTLAVFIFATLTILIVLVAMFPLNLSIHGCINLDALAETDNMTTGYELGDTQRQLKSPSSGSEESWWIFVVGKNIVIYLSYW